MNPASDQYRATHLYYDRSFARDAAKVLPGEYYVTAKDMVIVTVLGSCVAACVRDRILGVGGMNHFMLPDGADAGSPVCTSMRYGSFAMKVLIDEVLAVGGRRENLEAKVFGGGRVLRQFSTLNVGEQNAAFVRNYLAMEKIPIMAEDMNSDYPRKICFFPQSGKVLMKKLTEASGAGSSTNECDSVWRMNISTEIGAIELF